MMYIFFWVPHYCEFFLPQSKTLNFITQNNDLAQLYIRVPHKLKSQVCNFVSNVLSLYEVWEVWKTYFFLLRYDVCSLFPLPFHPNIQRIWKFIKDQYFWELLIFFNDNNLFDQNGFWAWFLRLWHSLRNQYWLNWLMSYASFDIKDILCQMTHVTKLEYDDNGV